MGRKCTHLQVFDAEAYLHVNNAMKNLDKRWRCPVCSRPLHPEELMLDPYAQAILDDPIAREVKRITLFYEFLPRS